MFVADFNDAADLGDALYGIAEREQWSLKDADANDLYERVAERYKGGPLEYKARLGMARVEAMEVIRGGEVRGGDGGVEE